MILLKNLPRKSGDFLAKIVAGLVIRFRSIEIGKPVLVVVFVVMVFVHVFPIALACNVDRISLAHISQVAFPAAGSFDIQDKAVIIGVIETCSAQDEVVYECALVQRELGFCASIVVAKTQCAAVCAAN